MVKARYFKFGMKTDGSEF